MKFTFLVVIVLSFSTALTAQSRRSDDALNRLMQKEMDGNVSVTLDPLIIENYNKHMIQNSRNRGVTGYRIRIFSDNGIGAKDKQKRVMADFLSQHPGISIYRGYVDSYYKIYVGDFRTRRDALKVLDKLKRDFHDAFIVEDIIVIGE